MSGRTEKPTLLAVDDTPENLTLLTEVLHREYRVLVARSGAAALELLTKTNPVPVLILLDIMMPGMDGFETLERLRHLPGCEATPVLIVSALDDVKAKVRGFAAGAADFITKPFEPEEVLARVRTQVALVEAGRMKDDVERIMRHDLKSPLHGILATAGFELENDGLDPSVKESFQVIYDSGQMLLDMINLSLDLFKIEQGTFQLSAEPVDLNEVLGDLRRQLDAFVGAGNLTWVWQGGEPADGVSRQTAGRRLLCASLLGNLLRNAVEASPRGGTVTVSLGRDETAGHLAIRNAGEVPPALRDRLFQKYATAGKISGTGLGLYSARLLAGALNCGLEADLTEAGHTTFRLSFPRLVKE